MFNLTDEFTRRSLSGLVAHSIDADDTVASLDKFAPQWQPDNQPQLSQEVDR